MVRSKAIIGYPISQHTVGYGGAYREIVAWQVRTGIGTFPISWPRLRSMRLDRRTPSIFLGIWRFPCLERFGIRAQLPLG